MTRVLFACLAILSSSLLPLEQPTALSERLVVVPTREGKDCVDLDSRWGVGALLAWRQTICGSGQEPVWVQTDCSQDFSNDGFWIAMSEDGMNFDRKAKYNGDQVASTVAQFVCFSVGRQ